MLNIGGQIAKICGRAEQIAKRGLKKDNRGKGVWRMPSRQAAEPHMARGEAKTLFERNRSLTNRLEFGLQRFYITRKGNDLTVKGQQEGERPKAATAETKRVNASTAKTERAKAAKVEAEYPMAAPAKPKAKRPKAATTEAKRATAANVAAKKTIATAEAIPPRSHPSFQILRDVQLLEQHLNKSVKLPRLGTSYHKELVPHRDDPNHVPPILLTQQRIDTIKRFHEEMALGTYNVEIAGKSLILSGPNGQGKSVLSFLMACTAYANGCFLVYMPHLGPIVQVSDQKASSMILHRMRLFNADLMDSITVTFPSGYGKTMTLTEVASTENPIEACHAVLEALSTFQEVPVVYIMDEHNEIWKSGKERSDMWRPWIRGSGIPHGLRTYIIYSGSAHSPFELSLQSNMRAWVVRLQPLNAASFQAFVEMGAFPLSPLLSSLLKSHPDRTFAYLRGITHGNPRETRTLLHHLSTWSNKRTRLEELCERWVDERQAALNTEIIDFCDRLSPTRKKLFFNFLQHWFGDPGATGTPRSFFDTGLLYELTDEHGETLHQFKSTSLAAYRAMLQYYFDIIVPTFLMNLKKAPLNGYRFEALVIEYLKMNGFSGVGWRFGTPNILEHLQLPPPVRILELRKTGTPSNTTGGPVVYHTEALQNFPGFDVVLHVPSLEGKPQRLVFIQITISTPQAHESNKGIIKSLGELVPRLIEDITGIDHVSVVQDEFKNIIAKLPAHREGELKVEFVMITWKAKTIVTETTSECVPPNVLIVTKESLPFIPTTTKSDADFSSSKEV